MAFVPVKGKYYAIFSRRSCNIHKPVPIDPNVAVAPGVVYDCKFEPIPLQDVNKFECLDRFTDTAGIENDKAIFNVAKDCESFFGYCDLFNPESNEKIDEEELGLYLRKEGIEINYLECFLYEEKNAQNNLPTLLFYPEDIQVNYERQIVDARYRVIKNTEDPNWYTYYVGRRCDIAEEDLPIAVPLWNLPKGDPQKQDKCIYITSVNPDDVKPLKDEWLVPVSMDYWNEYKSEYHMIEIPGGYAKVVSRQELTAEEEKIAKRRKTWIEGEDFSKKPMYKPTLCIPSESESEDEDKKPKATQTNDEKTEIDPTYISFQPEAVLIGPVTRKSKHWRTFKNESQKFGLKFLHQHKDIDVYHAFSDGTKLEVKGLVWKDGESDSEDSE